MPCNRLLSSLALLCALIVCLPNLAAASPIFGTFNMTGTINVTATTITWNSDVGPSFTANMFTLSGGTSSFSGENGQNRRLGRFIEGPKADGPLGKHRRAVVRPSRSGQAGNGYSQRPEMGSG